jgi:hypothetical protein
VSPSSLSTPVGDRETTRRVRQRRHQGSCGLMVSHHVLESIRDAL